jgi:hypothetical protein
MLAAELLKMAAIAQDNFDLVFMLRHPQFIVLNGHSIDSTSRAFPSCPKTLPESRLCQKRFFMRIHVVENIIAVVSSSDAVRID